MRHARRKMAELAGTPLPVEEFYQLVEDRYEPYRQLGPGREPGGRRPGALVQVAAAGL